MTPPLPPGPPANTKAEAAPQAPPPLMSAEEVAELRVLDGARTQGEWRVSVLPDVNAGYFGVTVPLPLGFAQHVCDLFPFGNRAKAAKGGFVEYERTAHFIAALANATPSLLSTAERAIAMREALEGISRHAENVNINHVDFRIKARECADAALSATPPAPAQQNAPSARLAALEEENARLREALATAARDIEALDPTHCNDYAFKAVRSIHRVLAQQGGAR